MSLKSILFLILVSTAFYSCKTYYIPIDSLKMQLSDIDSTQLKTVRIRGPIGRISEYPANHIKVIKCLDKKGSEIELQNNPSLETRITTSDGKKTIFYFDRLYLKSDTLIGNQSRFVELQKQIPFSDITKIEIQESRKDFHYL